MTEPASDEQPDACPHCGAHLPVTGETGTGWDRGSCLTCGLQAIRPPGERWRAIRG